MENEVAEMWLRRKFSLLDRVTNILPLFQRLFNALTDNIAIEHSARKRLRSVFRYYYNH